MNEELRNYIDNLFKEAPKNRAVFDLKEEILSNSTEKYHDLMQCGYSEKDAYENAIHSIGDVSQLFQSLENGIHNEFTQVIIKKAALCKAIAIGLYILSFASMVIISEFFYSTVLGFVSMLFLIALATSILVYTNTAYHSYIKKDETMVEKFKEWNSDQKQSKAIRGTINLLIWIVTIIMYFIISFETFDWHITWIIFLIGACIQCIVNLCFQLRANKH